MRQRTPLIALVMAIAATTGRGEDEPASPAAAAPQTPSVSYPNAPQAVRAGNRLLLDEMPAGALEAYRQARELEPDAREIDFVQGLARFKLGEYDEAREAFENAATSSDESLVDDAIYSVGTTYHAEALKNTAAPQEAIAQLEQAMQRYRTVLASQPDHAAAGDANYKAASMWRSLKQQLEQQQQQEQQQGQCDNEQDQEEQQQEQQQDQGDQQDQEQQQQQQQDRQQEEEERQQEQAQQDEESEQEEEQTQAQQSREEQVSREQAERKLREMMQALRDRKKERLQEVQPVKVVPVDKDW